jgi:protein-S-isoprenylcysteine O-methyltransferase Ste14
MARSLPQLGRRGEGWVALQIVLLAVIIATGIMGPAWPSSVRTWLAVAAGLVALVGLYLFIGGTTGLGRQLTPFPKPTEHSDIKRGGVYGLVRHPIYGGVLLLALAWSLVTSPLALVPWAVAGVFLDLKRRREEAWLVEKHPEYDEYRRSVRAAFVPFVW